MTAQTKILQDDPHGQAMDRMYRWQRHIYDASRRYYLLGRNEMLRGLNASDGQSILEIGCGTGRNLKFATALYPKCGFYGLDISEEMLKTATANLKGVDGKVRLAQGDATNFDAKSAFGQAEFDRIYFSYTLSMVPQWQDALRHALGLLGEHGQLHIVDFGQCENWPRPFKKIIFGWLKLFDVAPRAELHPTLLDLIGGQGRAVHFVSGYGGYAWRAVVN